MQVAIARRNVVYGKGQGVSESIGDIRTALCQSVAPRAEVDPFDWTKMHIHTALSHALAAHAGKIGFAADFERKATVKQVIPHVPLRNPRCVHGADEITHTGGDAYTDLHRAYAVHLRNGQIG